MNAVPTKITFERYHQATEEQEGWCTECKDFTRGETEPDARDYECPMCGNDTVMGAEDALTEELLDLVDENAGPDAVPQPYGLRRGRLWQQPVIVECGDE